MDMTFEWDEKKRRENLKKHGLDFVDVWEIFENEVVTDNDRRFDYGEDRFYTPRILKGVVVVLSHTEDDDLIRVISFRRAEKYEEEIYFAQVRN